MKAKEKKRIFICQITENSLRVVKCLFNHGAKRRFVGLEVEELPSDTDDRRLARRLNAVLDKLGYRDDSVIITLARSQATCRYFKVPTQAQDEIERIISLQAPRYLPYPAAELVTGYQTILSDKEGYSHINLVIVHNDIIEHILRIFQEVHIQNVRIILSSFGLCDFYYYIEPKEPGAVMLIDIDSHQVELAIVFRKKVLFSRWFKVDQLNPNWENLFIDEVNKTQDAYFKEVSQNAPAKIILTGRESKLRELAEPLRKQLTLPVEAFSCTKGINISENLREKILNYDYSFTSLIGLGLGKTEDSLNLLPQNIKAQVRKISRRDAYINLILYIIGIILLLGLGIARNLNSKAFYLEQLKSELDKITKEARPLEDIEKRFRLLQSRSEEGPSSLDLLYELYKSMPSRISLNSFSYEEGNQVVLHCQTAELNSVFEFVSKLENSQVFKNFNIKVRYATKKKTQAGEIVDVEIVCLKK